MDPILVFGPWSERYDLGPGHPLTPRRFGPGIDLIRTVTQLAGGGPIRELPPEPASDAEFNPFLADAAKGGSDDEADASALLGSDAGTGSSEDDATTE